MFIWPNYEALSVGMFPLVLVAVFTFPCAGADGQGLSLDPPLMAVLEGVCHTCDNDRLLNVLMEKLL